MLPFQRPFPHLATPRGMKLGPQLAQFFITGIAEMIAEVESAFFLLLFWNIVNIALETL
jgi:hypothetical protein